MDYLEYNIHASLTHNKLPIFHYWSQWSGGSFPSTRAHGHSTGLSTEKALEVFVCFFFFFLIKQNEIILLFLLPSPCPGQCLALSPLILWYPFTYIWLAQIPFILGGAMGIAG